MELVTSTSLTEHQSSQNSKEEKNISANPQKTTPSSPFYAVHLFLFILRLTEIKLPLCQRLRPFWWCLELCNQTEVNAAAWSIYSTNIIGSMFNWFCHFLQSMCNFKEIWHKDINIKGQGILNHSPVNECFCWTLQRKGKKKIRI